MKTRIIIESAIQNKELRLRFWSKISVPDSNECWEWLTGKFSDGYGQFAIPNLKGGTVSIRSHRFSKMLQLGRYLPSHRLVLHSCDNSICCNPLHLFIGTPLTNMVDRDLKDRHIIHLGESNGKSNLIEETVLEIRKMYAKGNCTLDEVAKEFNSTRGNVHLIVTRQRWKHI